MKQIIRKVLWSIALILRILNLCLAAWHKGCNTGYDLAMADVVLQIETPEKYFIKKFDIKPPRRVQQ